MAKKKTEVNIARPVVQILLYVPESSEIRTFFPPHIRKTPLE
jgi:hypothetical protein